VFTKLRVIFMDQDGNKTDQVYKLSLSTSVQDMRELVKTITKEEEDNEYSFFHGPTEIRKTLAEVVIENKEVTGEKDIVVTYQPDSILRVRPVTRISTSLEGHKGAILDVAFSPNGRDLASASGDTTVRFWDFTTESPNGVCNGHKNWVLVVSWSPDGLRLASGDMDGVIYIWDPSDLKAEGRRLSGHKKFITGLAWEPLHLNKECSKMVSSSKDFSVRIWDTKLERCIHALTMHSSCVTRVVWSGEGFIYSSSEDRTIKMWDGKGKYQKDLNGHSHWVNCLSLNFAYALRTGYWDHTLTELTDRDQMQASALKKYNELKRKAEELMVSGSDDCSLIIWKPSLTDKPIKKLLGHQKPVNHVQFSPNGKLIVSASFDKSLRLWNTEGEQMAVFRGHVEAVYMVCWSLDSRMFVSGSKDSTMKVWDCKLKKLMFDLPGHADEVYALDWSPDGAKVASGSKDQMLRIWQN
jgi:ribosome assembly protein 4